MTAEIATKSAISVIAKPLADEKLCKKVLKLAKKGAKRKQIKRGVKEVVKALRKNTQGSFSFLKCQSSVLLTATFTLSAKCFFCSAGSASSQEIYLP